MPIIYAKQNKALYSTLQATLLFWQSLSKFLIDKHGFTVNPCDWCIVNRIINIVNRIINGTQCTTSWHMDDLKNSHASKTITELIISELQTCFRKETLLVVYWREIHNYLRMMIDFLVPGKVHFSMDQYIDNLLVECPEKLMKGTRTTPAVNHLFEVDNACPKLDTNEVILYHHLVAKLLYLCKHTCPDIQLTMSFLTTHIESPDEDDYKKIGWCLHYLHNLQDLTRALEADTMSHICWWINALLAVHWDYRGNTGTSMSFGKGSVLSLSTKQKINTCSSMETELVRHVIGFMGLFLSPKTRP